MNTYLLILYYGLHATTPSVAMRVGPLDVQACTEMADIGRDAQHVTTCTPMPSDLLALHGCKLTDHEIIMDIDHRNYTCQE